MIIIIIMIIIFIIYSFLAAPDEDVFDPIEEENKRYKRHVYVHDMLPFILVMRTLIDKVKKSTIS